MATPSIRIARTCSQCGNYGHNARTCTEQMRPSHTRNCDDDSNSNGGEGVMLFGVRLTKPVENNSTSPGSMEASSSSSSMKYRKCMSMDNLAQYEQLQQQQQQQQQRCHDVGYASDDGVHASGSHIRERKRGVPWTEEEHGSFLVGLNQVGKGDWRGISRNFVKTRSPTQVASHAQKYFLRRTNNNRRRRRNSVFDITTDTMSRSASADQLHNLEATFHQNQAKNPSTLFTSPCPPTLQPISTNHQHTKASVPPSLRMASLNLNESPMSSPTYSTSTSSSRGEFSPFLSLKPSQAQSNDDTSRSSNFQGFNSSGRDNIISVA